jgi:hypothetical protein
MAETTSLPDGQTTSAQNGASTGFEAFESGLQQIWNKGTGAVQEVFSAIEATGNNIQSDISGTGAGIRTIITTGETATEASIQSTSQAVSTTSSNAASTIEVTEIVIGIIVALIILYLILHPGIFAIL